MLRLDQAAKAAFKRRSAASRLRSGQAGGSGEPELLDGDDVREDFVGWMRLGELAHGVEGLLVCPVVVGEQAVRFHSLFLMGGVPLSTKPSDRAEPAADPFAGEDFAVDSGMLESDAKTATWQHGLDDYPAGRGGLGDRGRGLGVRLGSAR